MAQAKKTTAPKRSHVATYARDKRKGGWIIRVAGPNAGAFAGRTVPVTLNANKGEHDEELTHLIWQGIDQESGGPVALYGFNPKPRDEEDGEQADF